MAGWDDMIVVGRVARSHGNRGEVIVNPETDFADERFRPGARLYFRRDGRVYPVTVTSARFQRDRPIIGLEGVGSIGEAEALADLELRVPAGELATLGPDTFYHHDLIGCRVETVSGIEVGVVAAVEGDVGSSRLVVTSGAREVLIPLATEICPTIDVAGRRIVIQPPEGLLDLNR
jgi:16S rRNA processing protein RimM